jgi:hypothetical protein
LSADCSILHNKGKYSWRELQWVFFGLCRRGNASLVKEFLKIFRDVEIDGWIEGFSYAIRSESLNVLELFKSKLSVRFRYFGTNRIVEPPRDPIYIFGLYKHIQYRDENLLISGVYAAMFNSTPTVLATILSWDFWSDEEIQILRKLWDIPGYGGFIAFQKIFDKKVEDYWVLIRQKCNIKDIL